MKTSLNIEESLFRAAKKEAARSRKTLSETITIWARLGWKTLSRQKRGAGSRRVRSVDLGGAARIDLTCRRNWLDALGS